MCFREDKGSTLAVTVATEACPYAEATRRYIYIYIYIYVLVAVEGHTADWNAGS